MLDEVRDSLFTVAWFGLMTAVWLGWAQESPVARLRVPLVVGAGTGMALAVGGSALERSHGAGRALRDLRGGRGR